MADMEKLGIDRLGMPHFTIIWSPQGQQIQAYTHNVSTRCCNTSFGTHQLQQHIAAKCRPPLLTKQSHTWNSDLSLIHLEEIIVLWHICLDFGSVHHLSHVSNIRQFPSQVNGLSEHFSTGGRTQWCDSAWFPLPLSLLLQAWSPTYESKLESGNLQLQCWFPSAIRRSFVNIEISPTVRAAHISPDEPLCCFKANSRWGVQRVKWNQLWFLHSCDSLTRSYQSPFPPTTDLMLTSSFGLDTSLRICMRVVFFFSGAVLQQCCS